MHFVDVLTGRSSVLSHMCVFFLVDLLIISKRKKLKTIILNSLKKILPIWVLKAIDMLIHQKKLYKTTKGPICNQVIVKNALICWFARIWRKHPSKGRHSTNSVSKPCWFDEKFFARYLICVKNLLICWFARIWRKYSSKAVFFTNRVSKHRWFDENYFANMSQKPVDLLIRNNLAKIFY